VLHTPAGQIGGRFALTAGQPRLPNTIGMPDLRCSLSPNRYQWSSTAPWKSRQ
jgi:hypothetical protein